MSKLAIGAAAVVIIVFVAGVPVSAAPVADSTDVCSVHARVVDEVTEYPVASARITVADSTGAILCDSIGYTAYEGYRNAYENISFDGSVPYRPRYKIAVAAKGYETLHFDITTPADRMVDLGTVSMNPPRRRRELSEVTVTASKIKMVMKGDTLEYDATAFQLQDGSMLDGLIAALPGATLDNNGRITVNGRFVSELLVNGRKFFAGDPQVALRNLPAYTVKKVQVYQKEPDELRGVKNRDRSADPLVMDVNLKKEYMNGWIANAEGGYGSGTRGGWSSRWLGRLFAMTYDKYSYLAIHSSANNLNDPEAAGSKGEWRKPSATSGEITTKRIGIEYNTDWHDQKYAGVNTKLNLVRQNTFNTVDNLGEAYMAGGNTFSRSLSALRRDTWQASWYGETSRNFDRFLRRIWFSAELKYENGRMRSESTSAQSNSMLPDNFAAPGSADFLADMLYRRQEISRRKEHSFMQAYRLYAYLNRGLSINGNATAERRSDRSEGTDFIRYDADSRLDISRLRRDALPTRHYQYELSPTWRLENNRHWDFSITYSYTQKFHHGERTIDELNTDSGEAAAPSAAQARAIDYANSYRTSRRTWSNALSPDVSYKWGPGDNPEYAVSLTANAEYVSRHVNDHRNFQTHSLKRHDWCFFGRLSLGRGSKWWGRSGYGVELTLRQTLPDMMQMLDVRDSSNPLVLDLGNPDLKKATKYGASVFFRKELDKGRGIVDASVSYSLTDNALARARSFDRLTGVTTWRPCNISGNRRVDGEFNYSVALLPGQKLSITNSLNPGYARSTDFSSDSDMPERSEVDNWTISDSFNADYDVMSGLTLSAKVNLNWASMHSRSHLFSTFSYTDVNYGIGVKYTLPGGIDLDTDLMAYCRRGYEDPAMNSTDWVWNLQLSKTFGRSKQFTVKAVGFDLLGQLPTVKQVVNAQGRTETRYNSQPAYALLTLTYRLDLKPKKK